MDTDQYLILSLLSLFFGVTAKYADLVNEHGLKEYFKGSGILAGLLWGAAGIGILQFSPFAGITYIAHVLYWFQLIKLEFPNHALAGVMILLGGFFFQGDFLFQHRNELFLLYLAYTVTGYIQSYFKRNNPSTYQFWRLRLRIYLIPLIYSFYLHNSAPFIATLFGMIGCEVMTYLYRAYKDDLIPRGSP